ncbi:hypothetical protein [Pedobacter metabolipauper]|uniref:Uncharacterized protein n=1 Tax=Pedobacter metabolipauper TaxID=425513 RepID=A0A4R6SX32_9SPHI|nr:hypothetical protein [Pedobacter metabolipauper]TDQ08722.1 hypothetical protein ATK78_3240 [Pedobacter metabolipauper]
MKKLLLLLLCTTTLGLVSCKKETLIDTGLPNQTIETVINQSQWTSVENGTRLTVTVNFPEIDAATFRNDGLLVYFYPNNSVDEYKQLPYVFDAQTYSYTARPGSITFDIQTTGDAVLNPVRPTAPIGLRVVIVTSSLN